MRCAANVETTGRAVSLVERMAERSVPKIAGRLTN